MPRDGTANLIPLNRRTKEERKELAIKAGIASGVARNKKKLLRESLEILLESCNKDGKTNQEEITVALIDAAKKGDVKAFEVIRDTIGQKPIDRSQVEIETPVFIEDLQ